MKKFLNEKNINEYESMNEEDILKYEGKYFGELIEINGSKDATLKMLCDHFEVKKVGNHFVNSPEALSMRYIVDTKKMSIEKRVVKMECDDFFTACLIVLDKEIIERNETVKMLFVIYKLNNPLSISNISYLMDDGTWSKKYTNASLMSLKEAKSFYDNCEEKCGYTTTIISDSKTHSYGCSS